MRSNDGRTCVPVPMKGFNRRGGRAGRAHTGSPVDPYFGQFYYHSRLAGATA